MKGEFIISSFCRGGHCTVQIKHNSIYAVVCGPVKGFPFGLILKGLIKLSLKKWGLVYTNQNLINRYNKMRRSKLERSY